MNKNHLEFGILFLGFNPLMYDANGSLAYLNKSAAIIFGIA